MKHTVVGHEAAGKTGEPPESTPPLSWFPPGCAPAHLGKWLCPSLGRVRWWPSQRPSRFRSFPSPLALRFAMLCRLLCNDTTYHRNKKYPGLRRRVIKQFTLFRWELSLSTASDFPVPGRVSSLCLCSAIFEIPEALLCTASVKKLGTFWNLWISSNLRPPEIRKAGSATT